jgi:hypothetical protein
MQTITLPEQRTQPWGAAAATEEPSRTTDLVELLLKDRKRLDAGIRDDAHTGDLIPRLLAVAVVGFAIFGIATTLVLNLGPTQPSWVPSARWTDGTWASLTLAYVLGLVAATGVCLPSFYFYGLLAGVKLSMLQASAYAVKCLAVTAVVLIGALPIYVAVALGMIVFSAPAAWMEITIGVGLALPFIAGLWGVQSLFVGFTDLADTLPPCRRVGRATFLRRLTLAWAACYTTVTPLMIYWLWTGFGG